MVQNRIEIQIKLRLICQTLLIFCSIVVVSCANSTTKQTLQDYVVENIATYSDNKGFYNKPFEWDTFCIVGTNCNQYKIKNTHPSTKSIGWEDERLSIIVCDEDTKYILRKYFWHNYPSIPNAENNNIVDLELFVNEKNSLQRITYLGSVIDFHEQITAQSKCINNIDTIMVRDFEKKINSKKTANKFCSNIFSDAINSYFFSKTDLEEKLVLAYFFESSITSYWVWRNGKKGYWHIIKKEFDANNYFAKPEYQYRCPH